MRIQAEQRPMALLANVFGTPESRPYMYQYVSLMLILLVFSVGAFSRKAGPSVKEPKKIITAPALPAKAKEAENAISQPLSISNVFDAEGAAINLGQLSGVIQVLEMHDLIAEIEVGGGSFDQALARSVSLTRALTRLAIPPYALRIYAVDRPMSAEMVVTFQEEDSDLRMSQLAGEAKQ